MDKNPLRGLRSFVSGLVLFCKVVHDLNEHRHINLNCMTISLNYNKYFKRFLPFSPDGWKIGSKINKMKLMKCKQEILHITSNDKHTRLFSLYLQNDPVRWVTFATLQMMILRFARLVTLPNPVPTSCFHYHVFIQSV